MSDNSPFEYGGPESTPRESIPDKTYKVNGIEEFLPNCVASDGPCFVESNGEMKVMLKLRCPDGNEGPAWSGNAAEFLALVYAFGGDFQDEEISGFQLNENNRMSSIALQLGKRSANREAKVLSVKSAGGWARGFPVLVPEGKYKIRFVGAFRKDREANNYHFDTYPGKNGNKFKALVFEFEVTEGLYKGLPLVSFMNDVFINSTKLKEDEENELPDPVERGMPIMLRAYPSSVSAWENFALYFAPSFLQHKWETKAEDSVFNVVEVYEPQFVYITLAHSDKKTVVTYLEPRKKGDGIAFTLSDLHKFNVSPLDKNVKEEDAIDETAGSEQSAVLLKVIDYIEKKWPDVQVFKNSKATDTALLFTKEGKDWAKEYLAGDLGPWALANLPTNPRPSIDKLNDEQLTALLDQLVERNGELEEGW